MVLGKEGREGEEEEDVQHTHTYWQRSYHKSNEEPSVRQISAVHLVLIWENIREKHISVSVCVLCVMRSCFFY